MFKSVSGIFPSKLIFLLISAPSILILGFSIFKSGVSTLMNAPFFEVSGSFKSVFKFTPFTSAL